MHTSLTWIMLGLALVTPALPIADGLAAGSGLPKLQTTRIAARRVVEKKKRKPRRNKRRLQPLGGSCLGTSVITATDEIGNPIFPRSLVPVTTDSFLFTDVPPAFGTPPARFRAIVLTEDPPMVTLADQFLGRLTIDGGLGVVAFESGNLVRCTITTPVQCSTIFSFQGRRVQDMAVAGEGLFVVLTNNALGNTVARLIVVPTDGSPAVELSIAETDQLQDFFAETVAVKDGVVFIGGYRSSDNLTMTAGSLTVPLDGGALQQLPVDLGSADSNRLFSFELTAGDRQARFPKHLAFVGSDLIIASSALLPAGGSLTGVPEPSHLVRIRFDGAGGVDGVDEIPVSVSDGFVNITGLESLAGELFVIDSRYRTRFETLGSFPPIGGRILRVCPS